MENFITILYDFEKEWLSSFASKAIVIRAVPQKFLCLVKKRNGTFKNEKIIIPAHHTFNENFIS